MRRKILHFKFFKESVDKIKKVANTSLVENLFYPRKFCWYLCTTDTSREGKKWQSRSRRSCRKVVLSPKELRIAGIVRIRDDTQESEFRETVSASSPFVGFSRLLSPNLDYSTSTSRELDFISPVGVAKEDPFLCSRALVKGEESDGIHLRWSLEFVSWPIYSSDFQSHGFCLKK